MADHDEQKLIHIIARVDQDQESGEILYVNPSRVRSNNAAENGAELPTFALVLRDAEGTELGRVHPQVRYDMCANGSESSGGLIQQDVTVPDGLAIVELVHSGKVLDSFRQSDGSRAAAPSGAISMAATSAAHKVTMGLATPVSGDNATYTIQARPDNSAQWYTLSIGQKFPEFEFDKNQFPGAKVVDVRFIRNLGFEQQIVADQRFDLKA
jgi:hypothetical protein